MKKYYWFLWIALIAWSGYYNLFITTNSTYLDEYFTQNLDGFSIAIFNVMGFFPLLFILDGFLFHRFDRSKWLLWTAFLLGGFVVFPVYLFGKSSKRVFVNQNRWWALSVLILATLFSGYFLWTLMSTIGTTTYFDRFLTDVFIGIMTVDFFVLYALSIVRSLEVSRRWAWFSVIPLVGFPLTYALALSFPSKD
jgi:hypothetical protein